MNTRLLTERVTMSEPVTPERLQGAITYVAKCMVTLNCPELMPILDILQAELEKFDREEDPIGRARRVLAAANDNHEPTVRCAA